MLALTSNRKNLNVILVRTLYALGLKSGEVK